MKSYTTHPIDVSIIIVNYHTEELIIACIQSILRHTEGLNYEIIVVDNGSSDHLREAMSRSFAGKVTTICPKQNVGFARANNMGIQQSAGRHVLFLNPDTLLLNNAIKFLCDYLDLHTEAGACGGNLFDTQQRPTHSFRRLYPGIFWQLCDMSSHALDRIFFGSSWQFNYTEKPFKVAYICGADLMVRRSVLEEVGGFASDFFMYYEETDLCHRITQAGYQIHSVPEAAIQHLEGSTEAPLPTPTINELRLALAEHGRYVYYRRNLSWPHRFFTHAIYTVSLCAFSLAATLLRRSNAAAFRWRLRIFMQLIAHQRPDIFQGLPLEV